MPISFLVVDDFLSNGEEFRQSALKLSYPAAGANIFLSEIQLSRCR